MNTIKLFSQIILIPIMSPIFVCSMFYISGWLISWVFLGPFLMPFVLWNDYEIPVLWGFVLVNLPAIIMWSCIVWDNAHDISGEINDKFLPWFSVELACITTCFEIAIFFVYEIYKDSNIQFI